MSTPSPSPSTSARHRARRRGGLASRSTPLRDTRGPDESPAGAPQDWTGRLVLDGSGNVLGHLTAIYVDSETKVITFAAISLTHRGRRRIVLVPVDAAALKGDTVTLRCGGDLVRRSPAIRPGRGLPAESEPALYAHYDLRYTAPKAATRRLVAVR